MSSYLPITLLLLALCSSGCLSNVPTKSLNPAQARAEFEKAADLIVERKFPEALSCLETVLATTLTSEDKSLVLTMMGNCYHDLDDLDKSLEFHNKAISEDPKNFKAYSNIGVTYRLLGQSDKAEEYYQKAYAINPDYAELNSNLGLIAFYKGDITTAINYTERAIKLDETMAVAYANLALMHASADRFEVAEEKLKQAIVRGYHNSKKLRQMIDDLHENSTMSEDNSTPDE